LNEGSRRIGEGGDGVVVVSWTFGLVWEEVPAKVEKEVWAIGNLPPRHVLSAMWGEYGYSFREVGRGQFISGGEQISLRPARCRWWRIRHGRGGRHASLWRHIVLVVEKQLVIHLETCHQKTDIGSMIEQGGVQTADLFTRGLEPEVNELS